MNSTEELARYVDNLLESAACPDYPGAMNGLQITSRKPIKAIASAVDFSTRTIEGALAKGANLLGVHHGMFWGGLERFVDASYRRIRFLIEHDVAVYSSHLPLDRHPSLGNNVLLARQLGLVPSGSFARYRDVFIGVSGSADIETKVLAERAREFARTCGGEIRTTSITAGQRTKQ